MKTALIKTAITGVTFCLAVAGASARGSHAGGHVSTHSAMSTHSSMGSTHMNSHATSRANVGGAATGLTRAGDVQKLNTKADDERGFTTAPGLDKAAKAKAKAKAKSDTDLDADDKTPDTDKKKTPDTDKDKDKKKSTARSNAGGTTRGLARAKQVQALNTTADTNRGFTSSTGLSTAGTATTKTKKSAKGTKSSATDDESRD